MNFTIKITVFVFCLFSIFNLPPSIVEASVPHLINYQGRLTDTSSKPLEGAYDLTFRLFDAETAGSLLWEEVHTGVVISKGIFSIMLGSVTNLDLPFDKQYYLEIKVGTEVMSPRQRITSSGYAIRAEEAESAIQAQNADAVGNVGISVTPTANKILPLDNNAKLPLSALKVYDSGWFVVSTNSNYTKTHNLGTTKVIYQLWFSPNASGEPCYSIYGISELDQDGRGNFRGGFVTALTSTDITISTSGISGNGNYVWDGLTSNNTGAGYTSGYYRVIMFALE